MNPSLLRVPALLALAGFTACAATRATDEGEVDEAKIDNELTSNTALARTLKFQGVVYVATDATGADIVAAVHHQTQSAFGALRTAKVGVNSRELKDIDVKSFVKTKVAVVDAANPTAAAQPMLRVKYTYTDTALVPKTMARRSAISLAMLGTDYESHTDRVLAECTAGDKEAHEFLGSIWYVFDPSQSTCAPAIAREQKQIDADRKKLKSPTTQVTRSEVDRLYVPMTVSLTGDKTNKGTSWPEYDRLFKGGVQPGKLVIGMVSGKMDDWAAGEHHDTIDDVGYDMWMRGLREIRARRPELALVSIEGGADLTRLDVGAVHLTGVTFDDLLAMELDGTFPASVPGSSQRDVRVAIGNALFQHWLRFEAPMQVTAGATTRPLTIELDTYFGAETDPTPHKRAIKNSDVFVYNGHSYIGYGPLDPSNFRASDFPSSYQIMFVNGCVSFNYYEKDYFTLKSGGTRNLELVTNGLESWVDGSGPAMGRFVGSLIDGKQESYAQLLTAAQFTDFGYDWGMDALRVVDGELDNVYTPSKTPLALAAAR